MDEVVLERAPRARRTRWLALAPALLATVVIAACSSDDEFSYTAAPDGSFLPPELPSGWTAKNIQYANRDMVAAANPLAVEAGVKVLAAGGSAVDAAIAVQMVLNLVEPQSSGIGGGAFMLHYDRESNTLTTYDGRETAPAAATGNMFQNAQGQPLGFLAAVDGGLSVGTPGLVRMLEKAHAKHGKLPWASLFGDAIKMSEDGFVISARLATQIAGSATRFVAQGEPVKSYFLNADNSPKTAGTLLKNPQLAASLRTIANGGANAFYTGPLAQSIVDKVRSHPTNPGRLTMQDMAAYQAKERAPLCGDYRGYKVCGMGPPSSGAIAVAQTLGILNNFNLRSYAPNSVDAVHLVSEAYRLAYADRAKFVADTDYVNVPVAGMLDANYLRTRSNVIRTDRTMGTPVAGVPAGAVAWRGVDNSLGLPSTSHMSIVDRAGNVVSMTTTIENGFGSLQMVGGFLLNNQLTDFSFTATDAQGNVIANRVEPGKRPRSSMSPTIVFNRDNQVEAILGSPGGSNIIQYVVKTLVGVVDWDMNIQQAINLPNFGAQTSATTTLERGTAVEAVKAGLEARGHTVSVADINSGVHGIVFNGYRSSTQAGSLARNPSAGTWAGGADPRREGTAKGNN